MSDRDKRSEYRGDVQYEIWRSGGNPDLADDECIDDCYDAGSYPEECAVTEIRRQRRGDPNE